MSKKKLVLFYSWSGTTRRVAKSIAAKAGADLVELQPTVPYPDNYNTTVTQAKKEIQNKYDPPLKPVSIDLNDYDVIYLGTPNWWSSIAPPVVSFLHKVMPADKTIAPFCTHGGGGEGHIARDVRTYCIGCDVLPLLCLPERSIGEEQKIDSWLKQIGQR